MREVGLDGHAARYRWTGGDGLFVACGEPRGKMAPRDLAGRPPQRLIARLTSSICRRGFVAHPALSAPGEHILPVPPLELPPAQTGEPLDRLRQNEAIKLFVERYYGLKGHGKLHQVALGIMLAEFCAEAIWATYAIYYHQATYSISINGRLGWNQ